MRKAPGMAVTVRTAGVPGTLCGVENYRRRNISMPRRYYRRYIIGVRHERKCENLER